MAATKLEVIGFGIQSKMIRNAEKQENMIHSKKKELKLPHKLVKQLLQRFHVFRKKRLNVQSRGVVS